MMRSFFALFFLSILWPAWGATEALAQKPKPRPYASKKQTAAASKLKAEAAAAKEKEELEKALAEADPARKVGLLRKFNENYPQSAERTRVLEIIVSARAQMADERLRAGDAAAGVELFKRAVSEAPVPVSEKLFTEVIVQFPTNLFYGGEPAAAVEVAKLIEEKIQDNAKFLLALSAFYLGTENADDARALAEKAIALDPNSPSAYQALGFARRLGFQLDEAAAAYQRALELDPESAVSKRSLAEMKRALGKPDESITLYRELLEKSPDDAAAQTGLTLALFAAGKREEAEAELARAVEKNPGNLPLLVGAAYWYAAQREGAKAVEYAQKAVDIEPRYTWGRIALARGHLVLGKPLEAERQLLAARQYGNFPTLDYEIASARLAAGLYEEAARELRRRFAVSGEEIETRLGNRVPKRANNFIELIELERRASIFEPLAADDPENAERLKSLLRFNQAIAADPAPGENAKDEEVEKAVADFVKGEDKAKIHRQLYAASRLLEAKRNLPKALELTDAAINSGAESGLEVPNASAAVMADELFDSRNIAMTRNEVVVVPEIPRQTLLAIMRGRIEELAGWTLYRQDKPQEAVVRLKRAVSILPEKSAWWRSSTWRLGAALEAAGRQPEALEMYVKNYQNSQPDAVKYSVIESLYQKVNGHTDGLEQRIGVKPAGRAAPSATETAAAAAAPTTETANPQTAEKTENAAVETPSPSPAPDENTPPKTEEASKTSPPAEEKPEVETEDTDAKEKSDEKEGEKPEEKTEEKTEEKKAADSPEAEVKPAASPSPAGESKTESGDPAKTADGEKTAKTAPGENADGVSAKPTPKPLFDPIVITVPKTETAKPRKSETDSAAAERAEETARGAEEKKGENKSAENKTGDENKAAEISDSEKPASPAAGSGEVRPRRLLPPNPKTDGGPTVAEINSCRLRVNKESLTLINQGIGEGLWLRFEGTDEDVSGKITPVSSNPTDIIVAPDPKIAAQPNRVFYIIKSVSPTRGVFTVTFDSPCGKKEILVKVR